MAWVFDKYCPETALDKPGLQVLAREEHDV
jgi:hypothetical protein